MALKLRNMGITRVRPLLGGFAEWKQRGFALEEVLETTGVGSTATSA
jgi:rhodanese-related sulfurtransferase